MLDGGFNVSVLRISLCQLPVRLALPGFVLGLLAKTKELLQILDCLVEVSELLLNFTYFLIALSLHLTISRSLGSSEALLKVVE